METNLETQTSNLKPLRILGIDPGYERCGFAILEKAQPSERKDKLVYSDCFRTHAHDAFSVRLSAVAAEVRRLIATYEPSVCALETLFFTKNQKTGMHVAEVRGALLLVAHESGIPLCEFGPSEIKLAVAGDGRGDKRQVQMMVRQLVGIEKEITYDDEFDAIAVALTASATRR